MLILLLHLCLAIGSVLSQTIAPQSNVWNSTFALTAAQVERASLSSTVAGNIDTAIEFERTNRATGSVRTDPFYDPPANTSQLPFGSVLRVDEYTNTTAYTLPPNTALSRLMFQSETINGSRVPASAFVLWPWLPRRDPRTNRYAVVGWAHGTSGVFDECAPSHVRDLDYQYSALYTLALQGYVVVAPDYAGLGVNRYANGTTIRHPYISNPSHANDLFHAVAAAQKAWPQELSGNFVLMGHSQGGGAAWGAAQRQAMRPVPGYLGSVAGSPVTDFTESASIYPGAALNIVPGLAETLPGFELSELLTPKGVQQVQLLREIGGCNAAVLQDAAQEDLVKPDWQSSPWLSTFLNLTRNGGKPIAGPMLVLQGTSDPIIPESVTTAAVNETCAAYPDSRLEYALFEGASHVPVLYASQRIWLDWIADRFAGWNHTAPPCTKSLHHPARRLSSYQKELTLYLELANQAYELS